MKEAVIENWSLGMTYNSPYSAPETGCPVLSGEVYGHNKFGNGKKITTSKVLKFDINNKIAITRNTLYRLGEIDISWKTWLVEHNHSIEDYNFNKLEDKDEYDRSD